ncbi:METTL5 family protein [Natronoglomus mannanivorans]|uniref:METTL5 family protein n=1 Tax=Natronoglomus mannanivorans TaxID=2979990 RepID=A0AAP2YZ94_9EURY|nr:METTL5 family protein [Halobacteria archaeon AArc-xg1-1]
MGSRGTIARRLEAVTDFDDPSPALEQYLTPPEIAAHIVHLAGLQNDLTDGTVVDLGTGTGMLAIGAAMSDADRVIGIDVDRSALEVARENESRVFGLEGGSGRSSSSSSSVSSPPSSSSSSADSPIDWLHADVNRHPLSCPDATVLSNPPFGAQRGNRHADRAFLETAREIGRVSYTIHNEGSQEFVESFATDNGGTVTHAFRASFSLEHRFGFHEDERRELDAEVFRIEWRDSNRVA